MTIQLTASLALGDPMLDRDHAELFRLVQVMLSASGEEAVTAFDALRVEAYEHFDREDADLRRLGGNNAACHLDEHAAVLQSLDEVSVIIRDPATSPETTQRLVESLALELHRWLPEHVNEMDASLAAVRSQSRFGGAPLRLTRRAPAYAVGTVGKP
jgi:hemerythrin